MVKQRTIEKEITFSGKALQSGEESNVTCHPADGNTGIIFERSDIKKDNIFKIGPGLIMQGPDRRTTIGIEAANVQTVEHFLAALWGLGIDDLIVRINGPELPAMDGSAKQFFQILKDAGVKELPETKNVIKIKEPLEVSIGDSVINVFPDDKLSITYNIEYDCPAIGDDEFSITLDGDMFENEIAPARTFCLKKEAEALRAAGYGRGADFNNTLVMDDTGPMGTQLRFKNEPVRHKILDLIGDLYILGVPVIGRINARKSGHKLNAELVRKIYMEYMADI